MKILIIGKDGADSLERNLADVGQEFFSDEVKVLEFVPKLKIFRNMRSINFVLDSLSRTQWLNKCLNSRLSRLAEKYEPNAILVMTGAANHVSGDFVSRARIVLHSKIFCWFVDSSISITEGRFLFAGYDEIYFTDRGLLKYFSDTISSAKSVLFEGYHPRRHIVSTNFETQSYIAVVGSVRPDRAVLLEKLLIMGFNIRIFGPPIGDWYKGDLLRSVHQNRFLTYEDKCKVFNEAFCVLNTFHPSHLDAINCRIFEAIAAGSVIISQYSAALEDYFGKEAILSYKSFSELVAILSKLQSGLLNTEEQRKRVSKLREGNSLVDRYRRVFRESNIF